MATKFIQEDSEWSRLAKVSVQPSSAEGIPETAVKGLEETIHNSSCQKKIVSPPLNQKLTTIFYNDKFMNLYTSVFLLLFLSTNVLRVHICKISTWLVPPLHSCILVKQCDTSVCINVWFPLDGNYLANYHLIGNLLLIVWYANNTWHCKGDYFNQQECNRWL